MEEEEIRSLANRGLTVEEIADALDALDFLVKKEMRRYDIPIEPWRNEVVLERLVDEGLSKEEIGDRLGCSASTVRRWAEKKNIKTDWRVVSKGYAWQNQERLAELATQGLSFTEMGERLGCTGTTVKTWLDKFDIEVEKPWEDKERLEYLYKERRLRCWEIAEYLGTSDGTISSIISDYGWEEPRRSKKYSVLQYERKMREWYLDEEMSGEDIADEVGCPKYLVYDWIKEHGMEPRWEVHEYVDELRDESLLRELYVEKELSGSEIAKMIGSHQSTVNRWLQKHGIPIRNDHMENRNKHDELRSEDYLRELHIEKGMNRQEIANEIGCSYNSVQYWMDKHGIEYQFSVSPELQNPEYVENLFEEKNGNREAMAEEVGCSKSHIISLLIRYGIVESQKRGYDELENKEQLKELYVERNLSCSEIAEELGCSRPTVQKWKDKHGLKKKWKKEDLLRELYINEELSQREIAEELGCGDSIISVWLQKFNIPTREGGAPPKEQHPNWKGGGEPYYGPTWHKQRKLCLERDGKKCLDCGITNKEHKSKRGQELHVHHVVPLRDFESKKEANRLSNLRTLCNTCHYKWEGSENPPEPRENTPKHL